MRICMMGKYPPVQGGVSAQSYWLARGFAEGGDVVHVVTNAFEVEPHFRLALTADDDPWLTADGRITVHLTEAMDWRHSHIPQGNPFVSKLTSLAVEAIEGADLDVVVTYYLEPYALAGYLAATFTGRPLVVRHAGSDVGRLLNVAQLGRAYAEVLKRADVVAAAPAVVGRFVDLGVPPQRIHLDPGFVLPRDHFRPEGDQLDVNEVLRQWPATDGDLGANREPIDPSLPLIGIYGKIGERKGLVELIRALADLKRRGVRFHLIALTHGLPQAERSFLQALGAAGIAQDTRVLPFLPHWRIPGFLRAMTFVCYLENRFPISVHTPSIPREVMACGTAIVMSAEVARKQPFAPRLLHGVNAFVVRDPRDQDELRSTLDLALSDVDATKRIGKRGAALIGSPPVSQAIGAHRELLQQAITSRSTTDDAGTEGVSALHSRRFFPLSRRALPSVVAAAEQSAALDGASDGLALAEALVAIIDVRDDVPVWARELVRWELLQLPHEDGVDEMIDDLFTRLSHAGWDRLPTTCPSSIVPTLAPNTTVRSFSQDMESVDRHLRAGEAVDVTAVSGLYHYVFQQLPRRVRVLAISSLHERVLSLCDGSRTAAEITDKTRIGDELGDVERLAPVVSSVLLELFEQGVLTLRPSPSTAGLDGSEHSESADPAAVAAQQG